MGNAAKRRSERLYTVIDTTWGAALLAWTPEGISRFELPSGSFEKVAAGAHAAGSFAAHPTGFAADAAKRIRAYFAGETVDLDDLPLDLKVAPFAARVYAVARSIPRGKTETYGGIATRLGSPGASRAVGGALGKNPIPLIVPCHRVLAANGRIGGFSATGGVAMKKRMLALEQS